MFAIVQVHGLRGRSQIGVHDEAVAVHAGDLEQKLILEIIGAGVFAQLEAVSLRQHGPAQQEERSIDLFDAARHMFRKGAR